MATATLETERLVLRMFRETDLDAYADMCADPEVMRYLGTGQCMSRAEAWRHMAMMAGHWQMRGYGMWAVQERSSDEMIGRIGCWFPESWPGQEIGWTLRRAYWGRGYATEAAHAAVRFAFDQLNWPRVISLIRPDNASSIRVAERLGERLDGQTQLQGFTVLVYAMSREEWDTNRQHD